MATGTSILVSVVDAQLFYGAAASTAATLAQSCADVTLKISWDTDEASDRSSQAKGYVATLYEIDLDVTFPADGTDAAVASFVAAAATATPIAVYVTNKAGQLGWESDYLVSLDNDQKLSAHIEQKFTLKRAARTGRIPAVVRR